MAIRIFTNQISENKIKNLRYYVRRFIQRMNTLFKAMTSGSYNSLLKDEIPVMSIPVINK